MAKILVFGATGTVGHEVAKALNGLGVKFRAAVRPAKLEQIKALQHAEPVEVDLYNPETIAKALVGIEQVFLMTPPGQTFLTKTIAEEAKKAGVKHIVKLSALGAENTDPNAFIWAHEHAVFEQTIKDLGIPLTSLRPSAFFAGLFSDAPQVKQGTVARAFGSAKLNFVSTQDIADVAAIALTQPGHEGKVYYLTGPENLSGEELAVIFSQVLGKTIKFTDLSDAQLRQIAATFLPAQAIDAFSNMFLYFRNGGYDKKFDDIHKVTGHQPRNVKAWIEENKAAFV